MKKITTFLIFLAMAYSAIPVLGQGFDTTAYKEHYNQRFDSFYYTGNYSTEDKVAGLSKAWAEAKYGFANFDLVPHLDWDSLYHAYIPKVMESPNPVAYYTVMMNFYQHLDDGHSSIFPPKTLWEEMFSVVPIRCQMTEDEVVITDVYSDDYPMLKEGQVIRSINGQTVKEYASSNISPYMSFSTPQDSISRLLTICCSQVI